MFQTQKNGWDGPVLGVKQATENKRQFDDEVSIFSHLPFPVIFMWRSKLTLNSCWCLRYWKLARAWLACNMEPTRVPPRYSAILKTHTELTIFWEKSIFFGRGITFIFFSGGHDALWGVQADQTWRFAIAFSPHKFLSTLPPELVHDKTKLETTSIIASLNAKHHSGLNKREVCFKRQDGAHS